MFLEGKQATFTFYLRLLSSKCHLKLTLQFDSFTVRTFPVRTFYLEDLLEQTNHVIEEGSRYAIRNNAANLMKSVQIKSRRGTENHEYSANGGISELFSAYSIETRK